MNILVTTSHKFFDDLPNEYYYEVNLEGELVFINKYVRNKTKSFEKFDSISIPAELFKEMSEFFIKDYNELKRREF